jgi:hypothetical protein
MRRPGLPAHDDVGMPAGKMTRSHRSTVDLPIGTVG